jgi:hypothetical protein
VRGKTLQEMTTQQAFPQAAEYTLGATALHLLEARRSYEALASRRRGEMRL